MRKEIKEIKFYTLIDNSIALYNNEQINTDELLNSLENNIYEDRIELLKYDNKLDLYIILYKENIDNSYYILIKNNCKISEDYYNTKLNSLINIYEDTKNKSISI